jgi:hypothetical protein
MCLRVSYKKKSEFSLASLNFMKKRVGSGVGFGSISQTRTDSRIRTKMSRIRNNATRYKTRCLAQAALQLSYCFCKFSRGKFVDNAADGGAL